MGVAVSGVSIGPHRGSVKAARDKGGPLVSYHLIMTVFTGAYVLKLYRIPLREEGKLGFWFPIMCALLLGPPTKRDNQ